MRLCPVCHQKAGTYFCLCYSALPLRYFQQVAEKENPVIIVEHVVSHFSFSANWTTNGLQTWTILTPDKHTQFGIQHSLCGAMYGPVKYLSTVAIQSSQFCLGYIRKKIKAPGELEILIMTT